MKTFEEHMQEAVGATYPIDIILNNLETEDIIEEVNNYAKEVAQEALNNASENARLYDGVSLLKEIQYIDEMGYDIGVTIDKQSILNESNIPKL